MRTHKECREEAMKSWRYRFWRYLYWPYYKIALPLWIKLKRVLAKGEQDG